MIAPLIIFCLTYLLIATRQLHWVRLDRTAGAIVGGVAMVVVGGISMEGAIGAIDFHVLFVLFGVLVIAAYLQEAQFFRYAAHLALTRAQSARSLLFWLVFVSGGLSALLVNDTVCVVLTPLVVAVVLEAGLPPLPYLLALASASNVGGVVSFTGNPQNMIIGAAAHGHVSFAQYFVLTLPIGLVCLGANAALLVWMFRRELPEGPLPERHVAAPTFDRVLALKALAALIAFAVLAGAGVSLGGASMVAASALMLVARTPSRNTLELVDWSLLGFFAGLFVVVAGVTHAGHLGHLFDAVAPVVTRNDWVGGAAFITLVVVLSNVVSNVPLVLVALPWIGRLVDPTWGYITLAVASTLAGNLTLFGSVANIIVMEGAREHGELSFRRFLRFGLVITVTDLLLAFGILALERLAGLPRLLGIE